MRQVPCGFVGNPQFPLKLVRGYTFLGLDNGVDRQEPLPQGQVGVVENGACSYREAVTA
jgi:hypothetical protein